MKARYYFNISEQLAVGEDISFIHTETDYDAESGYTNGKNHATISEPIKYDDNGTYYVEISWQNCDFYGSRIYQFRIVNDMNPETYDTVFDPTNDYSYQDLVSFEDDNSAAAITDKITLYADDKLVWGVAPEKDSSGGDQSGIKWGDADVDGDVTVNDVVTILCNVAAPSKNKLTPQGAKNADVYQNGDGISANDALSVQKYLADIIRNLPESKL